MGKNYYSILHLDQSASSTDIKKAYKALAIQYHTEYLEKPNDADIFTSLYKISEAYEILGSPFFKEIYDKYGEEGLKRGVPLPLGFAQPFAYHGDWKRTYREFFGSDNPFGHLITTSLMPYGSLAKKNEKRKGATVTSELYLSLEEIYLGCFKKMKVSRQVINGDKKTTTREDKVLSCHLAPGIPNNSSIIFRGEGDQDFIFSPGDIVFIVKEKEHPLFERSGNDVVGVVNIKLHEALCGTQITIDTLDKKKLPILITEIITPDSVKIITGEGFPIYKDPDGNKGNLVLHFNIEFPMQLIHKQKLILKCALTEINTQRKADTIQAMAILADSSRKGYKIASVVKNAKVNNKTGEIEWKNLEDKN